MPLFTIITAVYNNTAYIRHAVESVLQQDFLDYEYIIVDDGSTDGTAEILDEYAEEYEQIQVVHQTNQWIYASFNNGIAKAKGRYIYILNSDDRLREGILKAAAERMEKYQYPDVVFTKVLLHKCDADQNITLYDYMHVEETYPADVYLCGKEAVRGAWFGFYMSELARNQANFYKRELMLEHKFRNDVYGADTFFNIEVASELESALVLKEAAYDFFEYDREGMNTSVGKYFAYEHKMYNDIFHQCLYTLLHWEKYDKEKYMALCRQRLRGLTHEIRGLAAKNCPLSLEEKLQKVLCEYLDEVVLECVKFADAGEELEARVLSGLRELLSGADAGTLKGSRMYFVYELLESLLRYEKDEADYQAMREAASHPLNPCHIGSVFYQKLNMH
ncbi:glycosyltransferase [Lachnospiraceae bacterium]|nr:glycosyltransferase [Lachnospiraceae bacterium]